jgi:hypothetical protein
MFCPGQPVVEPLKAKEAEFLETTLCLGAGFSTVVDMGPPRRRRKTFNSSASLQVGGCTWHGARCWKDAGNLPASLTVTSIARIKGAVEGWTIRFRLWPLKKSDKVVHNQQANSGTEASRLE